MFDSDHNILNVVKKIELADGLGMKSEKPIIHVAKI